MVGKACDVMTQAAAVRIVGVDLDTTRLGDLTGAIFDARATRFFGCRSHGTCEER